jgi:hypothetical protein
MNAAVDIYVGRTAHVRETPFRQGFTYRVAMLGLDVDRLEEAGRQLRLFSVDRPNALSFRSRDFGERAAGAPLRPWAERRFAEAGVDVAGGRLKLICFPRVFGSGFSPISIWLGYSAMGALKGAIYEVHNTFGKAHAYVSAFGGAGERQRADKRFHVSPFFDVDGEYRFTLREPGDRFDLLIENLHPEGRRHVASLKLRRRAATDGALLAWLAGMPASGLGVVAAIHWQALRLWLKGARYRSPAASPADRTLAEPVAAPQILHAPAAEGAVRP